MKIKIIQSLLSVAVLAAMTNGAMAAGTTAGTVIKNTASIAYKVGTIAQTPIYSSEGGNSIPGVPGTIGAPTVAATETDFVVDRKIDLTVSPPAAAAPVTPNTTGNALTFQIENTGNFPQDYSLTISDIAGGNFDVSACTAAPLSFTALAVDTPTNVVVSCTVPNSGSAPNGGTANTGTVANTKTSVIDLLAIATGVTASTGTDNVNAVDIVFADGTGTGTDTGGSTGGASAGDRNAKHSAEGTYIVEAASLTVMKTEAVSKMSFDLGVDDATATDVTTGNRYHIPGATIVYTITVVNAAGATTAKSIVLSDTVPATMSVVGTPTIAITGGNGGTATMSSGANDNAVATNGFDLDAEETATLTITATVN